MWNSANKKQRIKLLTEVSGYMPPGHLSALVRLAWFPRMCHDTAGLRVVVACLQVRVVPYPDHQVQCVAFRWAHQGPQRPRCWMSLLDARRWAQSLAKSSLLARRALEPSSGDTLAMWSSSVSDVAMSASVACLHASFCAGSDKDAGLCPQLRCRWPQEVVLKKAP